MQRTHSSATIADAVPDRRRRGRRAEDTYRHSGEDLDGAYNDGAKPTPLQLGSAIRLYGSLAWIVASSAIGSLYLLKSIWHGLSALIGAG